MITTTAWTNAGTIAIDSTPGTINWINPNNAQTEDGSEASLSFTPGIRMNNARYLRFSNFGFSIPTDAFNIEVNLRCKQRRIAGALPVEVPLWFVIGSFSGINSASFNVEQSENTLDFFTQNNLTFEAQIFPTAINNNSLFVQIRPFSNGTLNVFSSCVNFIDVLQVQIQYEIPQKPKCVSSILGTINSSSNISQSGSITTIRSSKSNSTIEKC